MPEGPAHSPNLPTTPWAAPATLQLDVQGGEGLHADEVVHHARCVGIVGAIVEFVNGAGWVLEALKPGATVQGESAKALSSPIPTPWPGLAHMLTSPSRAGHAWGSPHRWAWTGPGRQPGC